MTTMLTLIATTCLTKRTKGDFDRRTEFFDSM